MIEHIFNVINLMLLIGLGVYAFRNYFLPSVKDALLKRVLLLKNLNTMHEKLKRDQDQIQQQIKKQELSCQDLVNKVSKWKTIVNYESIKHSEQKQRYLQALQTKVQAQAKQQALEHAQKKIAPSVLVTLERELIDYYHNESHVKRYITKMFIAMKKSEVL